MSSIYVYHMTLKKNYCLHNKKYHFSSGLRYNAFLEKNLIVRLPFRGTIYLKNCFYQKTTAYSFREITTTSVVASYNRAKAIKANTCSLFKKNPTYSSTTSKDFKRKVNSFAPSCKFTDLYLTLTLPKSLPCFQGKQGQNRETAKGVHGCPNNKQQTDISNKIEKTLGCFLNRNQYSFLEARRRMENKKIHTKFRSIISDQKKRASFAKSELNSVVLKTLLTVNGQAFDKRSISLKKKWGTARLKTLYSKLGPILFLDKRINPAFTKKTKSLSRIRNRCLLTGRSTIVGKYRLSRICFRQYAGSGLIPGLIKNKN
jgi:ribosomal protein S14